MRKAPLSLKAVDICSREQLLMCTTQHGAAEVARRRPGGAPVHEVLMARSDGPPPGPHRPVLITSHARSFPTAMPLSSESSSCPAPVCGFSQEDLLCRHVELKKVCALHLLILSGRDRCGARSLLLIPPAMFLEASVLF